MKKICFLLILILALTACSSSSSPTSDAYSKEQTAKDISSPEKSTEENPNKESSEAGQIHTISGEEAKKMATNQTVTIVDVRTKEEYDSGHVENAILLPLQTIGSEAPSELPDKDATILLYCRSGNRSAQAAEKLFNLGYKNIYDFGSATNWPDDLVK